MLIEKPQFLSLSGHSLQDHLKIPSPLISARAAHNQLRSIERYVRHPELGASSIAIEDHYIDRDFIEEYSVFYSKNLTPIQNYCRRVHFFKCEAAEAESEIKRLQGIGDRAEFERGCQWFAANAYLGFSVIKPLPGSPVGRTVLRNLSPDSKAGFLRDFRCSCDYRVHLMGVTLDVRGLAFQQQDRGVSACATTALWCALQRARELEGGSPATPAQITLKASQYALPFGRSMPSDGLSVDQMCQAVHSLGYAPNVFRAENFKISRWVVYSAVRSGIPPVLVLTQGKVAHAVTVAGMRVRHPHRIEEPDNINDELASDLVVAYVHDDRSGPYMRAEIERDGEGLLVKLELPNRRDPEVWCLSHILVPMHPKVRLSFSQLRTVALWLAGSFQVFRTAKVRTEIAAWVERAHSYLESQLAGPGRLPEATRTRICEEISPSRYIGVVRLKSDDLGTFDVLLDTTSTENNLVCLAVVRRTEEQALGAQTGALVAERLRCPYIG